LACRVPDLEGDVAYGSGLGIGDGDVFGEEIGADGGFVLAGEFFGVVSVHEGSFSDSRVTQDNDFQHMLLRRCWSCPRGGPSRIGIGSIVAISAAAIIIVASV